MTNINPQMASGAAWMLAYKAAERSISLVSTVILVRLLVPSDFGVVALAMSLVSMLSLISAFGFDMVIIQRRDASRKHYDTAWTFQVVFGLLIALLLVVSAVPTATFYNEPKLESVINVLALTQLIGGFENIGTIAFRKELEFHKEFWFMASKKFASFLVVIPLAVWLRNYWALVIGALLGKVMIVVISYYAHSYRPRFSLAATRELFSFSMWLVLNKVIGFVVERLPQFVLGKLSGMNVLGIFQVSYELSNMPTTELTAPINRAVYPSYAAISGDMEALRKAYLDVLAFLALFALPAGVGISVVADPLVRVILGPNWLEAIPLIEILALYGAVTALGSNTNLVYIAMGRPRLVTLLGTVKVLLLMPILIVMAYLHGVIGAAWSLLCTALIYAPVSYAIIIYILNMHITRLIQVTWRAAVASICMYWLVFAVINLLPQGGIFQYELVKLGIGVFTGAFSYAMIVYILWRLSGSPQGAETATFSRLRYRLAV